jgi:hypothetical protein
MSGVTLGITLLLGCQLIDIVRGALEGSVNAFVAEDY